MSQKVTVKNPKLLSKEKRKTKLGTRAFRFKIHIYILIENFYWCKTLGKMLLFCKGDNHGTKIKPPEYKICFNVLIFKTSYNK